MWNISTWQVRHHNHSSLWQFPYQSQNCYWEEDLLTSDWPSLRVGSLGGILPMPWYPTQVHGTVFICAKWVSWMCNPNNNRQCMNIITWLWPQTFLLGWGCGLLYQLIPSWQHRNQIPTEKFTGKRQNIAHLHVLEPSAVLKYQQLWGTPSLILKVLNVNFWDMCPEVETTQSKILYPIRFLFPKTLSLRRAGHVEHQHVWGREKW